MKEIWEMDIERLQLNAMDLRIVQTLDNVHASDTLMLHAYNPFTWLQNPT